jgi:16S rRNA U516 pseudouridylate synthase RsuA-like enzyme
LTHIDKEWKKVNKEIVETAEQRVGYQSKPENIEWFDEEWKIAMDGKYIAYNKRIDRRTSYKRLEYETSENIPQNMQKESIKR